MNLCSQSEKQVITISREPALRGKDVYGSLIQILCENETNAAQEGFRLVRHGHERSTCKSLPQSTGSLTTNTPLTRSE